MYSTYIHVDTYIKSFYNFYYAHMNTMIIHCMDCTTCSAERVLTNTLLEAYPVELCNSGLLKLSWIRSSKKVSIIQASSVGVTGDAPAIQ